MFKKRKDQISYAFLSLTIRIHKLNNKIRTYGTDSPLYEPEIHMIQAIDEGNGMSVTGLAEKFKVTKGAVSQVLSRLDKKGMIIKKTDPNNLSRLNLALTPKGETACRQHERLHDKFDDCVTAALNGASEGEKAFLLSFLNELDKELEAFHE